MEIYLNNNQSKTELNLEYWENFVSQILELLKLDDDNEISITFTNNEEIHKLNKEYRRVNSPTDVLSFPFNNELKLPIHILGDIIISIEKAEEQAKEFGHSIDREIAFLIVHGILHLLGYDHKKPEQEEKMISKQKELLKDFNF